jgi:rRNA maturation RNase YbeY
MLRMITIMAFSKPDQDIKIQVTRKFRDINVSLSKLRKLIKTICNRFGKKEYTNANSPSNRYEISIAIVDDIEFQKINYQFLRRKSISDCLSFDLSDNSEADSPKHFELVINGQMALRQAALRGHSDQAELALYITHALLHNFGFDDSDPAMTKNMHEQEDEILQELGYGLVYNKTMDSRETRNINKRKNKK